MSEARVIISPPCSQSFFSSRSIFPISTGIPVPKFSAGAIILEPAPGASVAREQFVRGFRAPGAGGILMKRRALRLAPVFLDCIDEGPRLLHFVAPGEERGVAAHGVEQEALVGF